MIGATFDVTGKNLDELIERGHKRAISLVGAREYEFDMEISQRVMTADGAPAEWIAECALTVEDPTP